MIVTWTLQSFVIHFAFLQYAGNCLTNAIRKVPNRFLPPLKRGSMVSGLYRISVQTGLTCLKKAL